MTTNPTDPKEVRDLAESIFEMSVEALNRLAPKQACPNPECKDGQVSQYEGEYYTDCPTCKGTGEVPEDQNNEAANSSLGSEIGIEPAKSAELAEVLVTLWSDAYNDIGKDYERAIGAAKAAIEAIIAKREAGILRALYNIVDKEIYAGVPEEAAWRTACLQMEHDILAQLPEPPEEDK